MVQASPLREASFHRMLAKPRAEHRVNGIFQHEDVVCHTQCQRTAGRAFAGDNGNDRHGQAAHFHQVACNGFALTALLGILAG